MTTRTANVTRLERIVSAVMEPLVNAAGGAIFVERDYEGYEWRCDGCGLVWAKRWYAEECEERGHKPSFEQGPYGVRGTVNGKPVGNPIFYTRYALRRDGGDK